MIKKFLTIIIWLLGICNTMVNASCTIFDIYESGTSILEQYKSYRKCQGFCKSYLYGLPIVPRGVVINEALSDTEILKIKNVLGNTLMCRPDAPINNWYNLPRGRELKIEDINSFLRECKEKNEEAILLCFQFPSVYFTGKYMQRYERTGAFNVVIDWEKGIYIEFVGKGFDGGELTKGKNRYHAKVDIPWHLVNWPSYFVLDFASVETISKHEYDISRRLRVEFLKDLRYNLTEVNKSIPKVPTPLSKQMFASLFKNCITNVLRGRKNFNRKAPTMLLIELFETKFYVVEVWDSNL